MASKQDEQPVLKGSFNIKGSVQLEAAETKPDVQLKAFAFSQVGSELGSSDVDAKGASPSL